MVTAVCGVTMEARVALLKWYGSYCPAEVRNKVETKGQLQFVCTQTERSCFQCLIGGFCTEWALQICRERTYIHTYIHT